MQTTLKHFHNSHTAAIGRLSSRGMRKKAEAGSYPGCAPVGYLNAWQGNKRVILPDPTGAPLVQEAFRLAAEGNSSLRYMVEELTAQGLRSRNGRKLSVSALWSLLTNPTYIGMVRLNGRVYPGKHQPLVSQELFDQVQHILTARRRSPGRS